MVILAQNYRQMLADTVLSLCISLVLYVLGAWGLYTLAKRRGIAKAWLAWIPVADLWVLGSVSNQFRRSFPFRKMVFRFALILLAALAAFAFVAMAVVGMGYFLPTLEETLGVDFWDMYTHYAAGSTEWITYLEEATLQLEMDEAASMALLESSMLMIVISLAAAGLSLATSVLEYICLFDLFASCMPRFRLAFLLLTIFLGVGGLLIFLCRNKDEGLEAARNMPRPTPWQMPPMPPQLPGNGQNNT